MGTYAHRIRRLLLLAFLGTVPAVAQDRAPAGAAGAGPDARGAGPAGTQDDAGASGARGEGPAGSGTTGDPRPPRRSLSPRLPPLPASPWDRPLAEDGVRVHDVPTGAGRGAVVILVGPGRSPDRGLPRRLRRELPRRGWATLATALPPAPDVKADAEADAGGDRDPGAGAAEAPARVPAIGAGPDPVGPRLRVDREAARDAIADVLRRAHEVATPVVVVALDGAEDHEALWLDPVPALPEQDAVPVSGGAPPLRRALAGYVRLGPLPPGPPAYLPVPVPALLVDLGGRPSGAWRALTERSDGMAVEPRPEPASEVEGRALILRVDGWLGARREALLGTR